MRGVAVREDRGRPERLMEWTPRRVEGCACGGVIVADPASEYSVRLAVTRHQATLAHRDWWARVSSSG